MQLSDLIGHELGSHTVTFDDRDAILYAIALGAGPDELDLVYEKRLRVLPTLACALGLWAVEAAGELGAYDRQRSLHAAQSLQMHAPLEPGALTMSGRISAVWDKGKAAVVIIEVTSDTFTAGYTIFLPGLGGWGGERGPSSRRGTAFEPTWSTQMPTRSDQAILYRLTGDRHPLHIDAQLARSMGFKRPILHGLCTLGMAAKHLAAAANAHPADLIELNARLAAPVLPGDTLELSAQQDPELTFQVRVGDTPVLKAGRARYG
ncbi:MAG: MaoC/PaaZ C-terminal domain-containing protein [Ardenticatenaceae bacterium]